MTPDIIPDIDTLRWARIGAEFVPLQRAFNEACSITGMTADVLTSGRTTRRVQQREMFYWALRVTSEASYPDIATICGHSSHSVIVTALKRFERRMEQDRQLRNTARSLAMRILEAGR